MKQSPFLTKSLLFFFILMFKPLNASEFSYVDIELQGINDIAPYCNEDINEAFCVDKIFYIEEKNTIFFSIDIDDSFFRHLNHNAEDILKETLNLFFLTLNTDAAKINGFDKSSLFIGTKYEKSQIVVGGKTTRDQKTYVGYYRLDKLDNLITYKMSGDYKDPFVLFENTAGAI